ncbi:MAG TPA: DUF692 family protein, partial [Methylomirabilota bacterium]|nr:DUF692 family protein [Methylomirabilota bacterium]
PAVAALERIRRDYPIAIHGVGLSPGSADGLDARHLARLRRPIDRFEPALVSEHLSWSAAGGAYLDHLLPFTEEALASWELTVQLFADEYRVPVLPPDVAAVTATSVELGCSTLLVLGLLTRLATLPLLGMLATIQLFVYPGAWSEHLVWGSILLYLLARGGGAVSLDSWVRMKA